jgi:hypothetical protein
MSFGEYRIECISEQLTCHLGLELDYELVCKIMGELEWEGQMVISR